MGPGAGGKGKDTGWKGITSICQLVGNFETVHPGCWGVQLTLAGGLLIFAGIGGHGALQN